MEAIPRVSIEAQDLMAEVAGIIFINKKNMWCQMGDSIVVLPRGKETDDILRRILHIDCIQNYSSTITNS